MRVQNAFLIASLALHVVAIAIQFDAIQLVLLVIFVILGLLAVRSERGSGWRVFWLFSGLALVAYGIAFAYITIPRTAFEIVNFLASVLKLVGALVGVIANAFNLELDAMDQD